MRKLVELATSVSRRTLHHFIETTSSYKLHYSVQINVLSTNSKGNKTRGNTMLFYRTNKNLRKNDVEKKSAKIWNAMLSSCELI